MSDLFTLKRKLEYEDDVCRQPKRARLNQNRDDKDEKKKEEILFLDADFTVYTEDYNNDAYEEREKESIESYWVCFIEKVKRAASDLKEKGYAVIPRLFNEEESTLYYRRMFALVVHYLNIENVLETTKVENKKTFEDFCEIFSKRKASELPPNKHGIWESHRSNHFDVVKAIRAHPKVALVFCLLYGLTSPTELVSSLDRINFKFPGRSYGVHQRRVKVDAFGNVVKQQTTKKKEKKEKEEEEEGRRQRQKIRVPEEALEGWAHVDQHMDRTNENGVVQSIQAYVTLMDVKSEKDPGIRFYEGSHIVWEEWTDIEKRNDHFTPEEIKELTSRKNWSKWTPVQKCKLLNSTYHHRHHLLDDDGGETKRVRRVHPTYPKGSMVLWDSKTTHDPFDGAKDRKDGRFVVYVCMLPRFDELATPAFVKSKKEVYIKGYATAHTPIPQERFAKTPRTYGKPTTTTEDAYFTVPVDKLSPERYKNVNPKDDEDIEAPEKDSLESYLFCFQEPTSNSRNKNKADLRKGLSLYPSPFLTASERYLDTLRSNPTMLAFPPSSSSLTKNNNVQGGEEEEDDDVIMRDDERKETTTTTTTTTTDTVITYKGVAMLESELASGKDRKAFETRNRRRKTTPTTTTKTIVTSNK